MPWVDVAVTQMIDFSWEKFKKNGSFHRIPNIETKHQCAYYENVDESSMVLRFHVCQGRICQHTACEPQTEQLASH